MPPTTLDFTPLHRRRRCIICNLTDAFWVLDLTLPPSSSTVMSSDAAAFRRRRHHPISTSPPLLTPSMTATDHFVSASDLPRHLQAVPAFICPPRRLLRRIRDWILPTTSLSSSSILISSSPQYSFITFFTVESPLRHLPSSPQ